MIPTQPGLPNPFEIPNTNPWNNQMWQCPYCQQWIGNAQYHNCQGTALPNSPLRSDEFEIQSSGVADFMMYGDFKKLFRADTVRLVRKAVTLRFQDDKDFPLDALLDVLDDVEDEARDGDLV